MNESPSQEKPFELLLRLEQASRAAAFQLPEKTETVPLWRGIAFSVDSWNLVAPLGVITDVVECSAITPVPRTGDWLRGITNVRGTLHSITDLARFLGRKPVLPESDGKLLVLNVAGLQSALLVSDVYGLKSFDEEADRGDAALMGGEIEPYVQKVFVQDGQPWGILDVHGLIEADAFREVEWKASA
jgi:twitching motility protein PilI